MVEVDVGPVVLSVLEAGRGGSPLLLLHGFTGAKEDFADWIDPLAAAGHHVVAPDLRGHGASSQPTDEAEYSLASFAADAVALSEHLGWDRFALLGHSMGGMAAQHLALESPERLRALVLMDTTYKSIEGIPLDLVTTAVEIARADGMAKLQAVMGEHESPFGTEADARVRSQREGYVEWNERKFRTCSPAMYAAMAHGLLHQADRLGGLAALDVPTLVMVGEQDQPFIAVSETMAGAIPRAQLVVLPGAGHSPQFEAPDAWWDALSRFLTSVS